MSLQLSLSSLYWASFIFFELRLSGLAVMEIAQSGDNEEAVKHFYNDPAHVEFCTDIFGKLRATPEAIRRELRETGAWNESELADDEMNRIRIVWQAAWQIAESDEPDCSAPLTLEEVNKNG